MDGLRDLFVGLVTDNAFVDVTEEGTEAAASTAVGMRTTSVAPEPPVLLRADHPFLFVIRDGRSGAVLFLGRLSKPG
jgi:serpin B